MPLQQLSIEIEDETDAAFVSDALFELGALSVSTTDLHRNTDKEKPIYAEPPQIPVSEQSTPTFWKSALITALFPLTMPSEQLLMTIATSFGLEQTPSLRISATPFDDKAPAEWVKHAQSCYKPVLLRNVVITFPWLEPIPNLANVVLDPGLAFGTGEHATTQLCARWLESAIRPGMKILDFGTGSGVLAILAARIADRVSAIGVDLDPDAIKVADANAKLNRVQGAVMFYENCDEPQQGDYDIVVANILAGPLKELADHLVGKLRGGGQIALSGILVEQAAEMRECYSQHGLVMEEASVDSGWVLLVGTKGR